MWEGADDCLSDHKNYIRALPGIMGACKLESLVGIFPHIDLTNQNHSIILTLQMWARMPSNRN